MCKSARTASGSNPGWDVIEGCVSRDLSIVSKSVSMPARAVAVN